MDQIVVVNSSPFVAKFSNTDNSKVEDDDLSSIKTQENINYEEGVITSDILPKKHSIESDNNMKMNKKQKNQ